jgi:hypothetical protein
MDPPQIHVTELPPELIVHLTTFLGPASRLRLRLLSRHFTDFVNPANQIEFFSVITELVTHGPPSELTHFTDLAARDLIRRNTLNDWIFYESVRLGRQTPTISSGSAALYRPNAKLLAEVAQFISESEFRDLCTKYHPNWSGPYWIFNFDRDDLTKLISAGYRGIAAMSNLNVNPLEVLARSGHVDLVRERLATLETLDDHEMAEIISSGNLELVNLGFEKGFSRSAEIWISAVQSQSPEVFDLIRQKVEPPNGSAVRSALAQYAMRSGFPEAVDFMNELGTNYQPLDNPDLYFRRFSRRAYDWLAATYPGYVAWLKNPRNDSPLTLHTFCTCLIWSNDLDLFAEFFPFLSNSTKLAVIGDSIKIHRLNFLQWIIANLPESSKEIKIDKHRCLCEAVASGFVDAVKWLITEQQVTPIPDDLRITYSVPGNYNINQAREIWHINNLLHRAARA